MLILISAFLQAKQMRVIAIISIPRIMIVERLSGAWLIDMGDITLILEFLSCEDTNNLINTQLNSNLSEAYKRVSTEGIA